MFNKAFKKLSEDAKKEHELIEKAVCTFNAAIKRYRDSGWKITLFADGEPDEAVISNSIELDLTVEIDE